MASIHASVEQFITAIDEHLCEAYPDFRFLRPDFRLLALVHAATTRLQDFVVTARRGAGAVVLPGVKLKLVEDPSDPLPSRSVTRRRKTKNPRQFELTERFIRAFRSVSADQLEAAAMKSRCVLQPACEGLMFVCDWDKDGRLQFQVTDKGAPVFEEPVGSEFFSGIGGHRSGTGKPGLKPFTVRFDYGPR
jgi:hypothetical protein